MYGKIPIIISLILLFSLLAGPSANSREFWTPGVTSGDYFTYQMYGIYASNRQNLSLVIPEFERNTTLWARINITGVSGSTIYQIYTLHYVDGRESTFGFQTDVNPQKQGTFKIADKGVPICAANLTRGDQIPTAELILNGTVIREYFDA
jgi:hypothetical protein